MLLVWCFNTLLILILGCRQNTLASDGDSTGVQLAYRQTQPVAAPKLQDIYARRKLLLYLVLNQLRNINTNTSINHQTCISTIFKTPSIAEPFYLIFSKIRSSQPAARAKSPS